MIWQSLGGTIANLPALRSGYNIWVSLLVWYVNIMSQREVESGVGDEQKYSP